MICKFTLLHSIYIYIYILQKLHQFFHSFRSFSDYCRFVLVLRMFFSEEILSKSRKNGISTAWLMATIGMKTSSHKFYRKDILAASVPAICESVVEPIHPLALRLSSNLLFGIALLYQQQINYLLSTCYYLIYGYTQLIDFCVDDVTASSTVLSNTNWSITDKNLTSR